MGVVGIVGIGVLADSVGNGDGVVVGLSGCSDTVLWIGDLCTLRVWLSVDTGGRVWADAPLLDMLVEGGKVAVHEDTCIQVGGQAECAYVFQGLDSLEIDLAGIRWCVQRGGVQEEVDTVVPFRGWVVFRLVPTPEMEARAPSGWMPLPFPWVPVLVLGLVGLGVLVLIGWLVWWLVSRWRGRRVESASLEDIVSDRLRRAWSLLEARQWKEGVDLASDTFRYVVHVVYGVPALEMTTRELVGALRRVDGIETMEIMRVEEVGRLLEWADRVKFARYVPQEGEVREWWVQLTGELDRLLQVWRRRQEEERRRGGGGDSGLRVRGSSAFGMIFVLVGAGL